MDLLLPILLSFAVGSWTIGVDDAKTARYLVSLDSLFVTDPEFGTTSQLAHYFEIECSLTRKPSEANYVFHQYHGSTYSATRNSRSVSNEGGKEGTDPGKLPKHDPIIANDPLTRLLERNRANAERDAALLGKPAFRVQFDEAGDVAGEEVLIEDEKAREFLLGRLLGPTLFFQVPFRPDQKSWTAVREYLQGSDEVSGTLTYERLPDRPKNNRALTVVGVFGDLVEDLTTAPAGKSGQKTRRVLQVRGRQVYDRRQMAWVWGDLTIDVLGDYLEPKTAKTRFEGTITLRLRQIDADPNLKYSEPLHIESELHAAKVLVPNTGWEQKWNQRPGLVSFRNRNRVAALDVNFATVNLTVFQESKKLVLKELAEDLKRKLELITDLPESEREGRTVWFRSAICRTFDKKGAYYIGVGQARLSGSDSSLTVVLNGDVTGVQGETKKQRISSFESDALSILHSFAPSRDPKASEGLEAERPQTAGNK